MAKTETSKQNLKINFGDISKIDLSQVENKELVAITKDEGNAGKVFGLDANGIPGLIETPLPVNLEYTTNKVALGSSNTNTQYPNAKSVYDECVSIREVAEGKCKSYVMGYASDESQWYHGTGPGQYAPYTVAELNDKTVNIEISISHSTFSYQGNPVDITDIKKGDNVFIHQTDIPDFWCIDKSGDLLMLGRLETTKIDFDTIVYADTYSAASSPLSAINVRGTTYRLAPLGNLPQNCGLAIGQGSAAYHTDSSIALGYNASAYGGSIAIGRSAQTSQANGAGKAVGIGTESKVGFSSVSIGYQADTNWNDYPGTENIAIGHQSTTYVPYTVSFDSTTTNRTITLYDTSKIFFRNENESKSKTTLAAFANGKTLQDVLDEQYPEVIML